MALSSRKDPEGSLMYVVCCRCKEFLDTKPGNLGSLTHGLCPKCFQEMIAEIHQKKKEKEKPGKQ